MKKAVLIKDLAKGAELTVKKTEEIYNLLVEVLVNELKEKGETEIHGIGKFKAAVTPAKERFIPFLNKKVTTEAKTRVSFKASKLLKDRV